MSKKIKPIKLKRTTETNRVSYSLFNPDDDLPLHVDSEQLKFREPQQLVIIPLWEAMQKGMNCCCNLPCGVGKSVIVNCLFNRISGKLKIIAVPKSGIANSFKEIIDRFFNDGFSIRADKIRILDDDNGVSKTDALVNLIETNDGSDDHVYIISHSLLVLLFKRIAKGEVDKNLLKGCIIGIDECHHVGVDDGDDSESNWLGKIIRTLNQLKVQHIFTSATMFRIDGRNVIPPEFQHNYHVESLAMVDLRSKMFKEAYVPDITVSLVRYGTDTAHNLLEAETESEKDADRTFLPGEVNLHRYIKTCAKEFLRGKRKTIIQVPYACIGTGLTNADIAVMIEDELRRILRKPCKNLNILNLGGYKDVSGKNNLVSSNEKLKKERYADLKRNNGIKWDIVISIAVMDEGLDWPPCARIFLPRMTTNSKQFIQRDAGRLARLFMGKNSVEIVYFIACLSETEEVDDEAALYLHKIMTNYALLLCNETVYDARPFTERLPGVSMERWTSEKKEIFSDYWEAKTNAIDSGKEWGVEDMVLFFSSHPLLEGNKDKMNSILKQAFRLDSITFKEAMKEAMENSGSKGFHEFYDEFGEALIRRGLLKCAFDQDGKLSIMLLGSASKVRSQLKKYRSGQRREYGSWPDVRDFLGEMKFSIKKIKTDNPNLRRSDKTGIFAKWHDDGLPGHPKCPPWIPRDVDKVYGAEYRMEQIRANIKKQKSKNENRPTV